MTRPCSVVGVVALSFLVWAVPASGQDADDAPGDEVQPEEGAAPGALSRDAQGRRLFLDGRIAFDEERYARALEYFRASYRLTDRPELLYNIGLSAERDGRPDEAREAFQAYLTARPDAENGEEVRARLAILGEAVSVDEEEDSGGAGWWIVAGVGALVAIGVVLTIVLVSGGDSVQAPLMGDVGSGGVVFALGGGD